MAFLSIKNPFLLSTVSIKKVSTMNKIFKIVDDEEGWICMLNRFKHKANG